MPTTSSKRSRARRNKNRSRKKNDQKKRREIQKDDQKKDDQKKDDQKKQKESTNCAVCMDEFCNGNGCLNFPNCQEARSGFPCACKTEDICNGCLISLIVRAPPSAYCRDCTPPCGRMRIQCPVCREIVNVGASAVQWAFNTLRHAGGNLIV
jgi:hypothetical protein